MRRFATFAFTIIAVALLLGCAQGTRLKPEKLEGPGVMSGTYVVYLYGLRHPYDLEGFAFLDLEGNDTRMVLRTYGRDYRVVANVSGKDGIAIAERFFQSFRSYKRISFRRIEDSQGRVVGYELQPLFIRQLNDNPQVYSAHYYEREGGVIEVRFFEPGNEPSLLWGK